MLTQAATITATTTQQIVLKPSLKTKLMKELRLYAELRSQREAIDAAMDKHKASIEVIRDEAGEQSLKVEGYTISLVAPVRAILDKMRLIANGVTLAQIEDSTVHKPSKPYCKISLPGEKERDY